ncbi:PREDICTED: disease resistance protein RPM1-like [Fragaria vesca subsp. vesca]
MAESSVNFLLEKLGTIFKNEVQLLGVLLGGVQEEANNLQGEFERMRAFLRTADALQETDEEVKVWVRQVRDIAHEAEDILDEFTLLLGHDHGDGIYGSLCRLSCCIKNAKACYRIASQLQAINSRVKNISEVHKRLQHKFIKAEQGLGFDSVEDTWQDHRGDALLLDNSDLVGIHKPKNQLVGWLCKDTSGRIVVSLAGMGGIGKTTLAKQVYDDPEVEKHFEVRAWVTVNRSIKSGELLKDMVQQLSKVIRRRVPGVVANMDNSQLKATIKELLQERRYLIVLDDIWHLYEWDTIQLALPNNGCGSRIMLTTRNAEVASITRILSDGKTFVIKPVTPAESWDLFCRKVFQLNKCPPHLQDICKDILSRCEGLPLAIVTIGRVLATKDERRIDEWEMVARSLGAEIEGNDKLKYLKMVLLLSFNDLPYFLKSCFLYLSIFPEGHLIERMRLIRLWVAEGLVEAKEGRTLEEVADDYLHELLNRSLIQVAETSSDGRIKTCRIHGFLHEIIISKSRDQNFTTVVKEKSVPVQWSDKIRRLSMHNSVQYVQKNRLLNVLDLQNASLNVFPVDVFNLFFLKYLSLKGTKVKTIPRFIGKLQNLQTLNLKHSLVTELPFEILKLKHLRHLLVYRYKSGPYMDFHTKYGFKVLAKIGALTSLQKLCFIKANEDGGAILRELGNLVQLRRLGIVQMRKEDGKVLCSSIEKLNKLCALSITSVEEDEIIDLQHLCSPPLLQRLYLLGRLETIPRWIPSLHSLVRLYLKWSRLKDDPLVFLQYLPNLLHLELSRAFEGDTLCFEAGGFKKLKHLGIAEFEGLKCIQVQLGAMPSVKKLIIKRCKLLQKVPSGIEHLSKLKVLEFVDMPETLIETLRPHEKDNDYWKVAHITVVCFTYWTECGWVVYPLEGFSEVEKLSP